MFHSTSNHARSPSLSLYKVHSCLLRESSSRMIVKKEIPSVRTKLLFSFQPFCSRRCTLSHKIHFCHLYTRLLRHGFCRRAVNNFSYHLPRLIPKPVNPHIWRKIRTIAGKVDPINTIVDNDICDGAPSPILTCTMEESIDEVTWTLHVVGYDIFCYLTPHCTPVCVRIAQRFEGALY